MKLLKKQPIALLITLLIVFVATFFGVNRSLGAEIRQAEDQFYSGVFDPAQNRVLSSIFGQLEQRATASLRILSIGEHSHPNDAALHGVGADLREARRMMIELLTSGSPQALFQADQDLQLAVERYYAVLHPLIQGAEGEDLEALESAYNTMENAARVITQSGYNEAIREFHRTVLGAFPTNVLMNFVFVSPPELFA